MNNSEKIRELNDVFRKTGIGGRIFITNGIQSLEPEVIGQIVQAVQNFDAFNPDNDPHLEHDFGSFTIFEKRILWKIDYFDKEYRFGSEDPSNPEITNRVLTIMLAEEY